MRRGIGKILLTGCLLASTLAVSGFAVALADGSKAQNNVTAYEPIISVAWGDYSTDNVPKALRGTPYKVFSATAEDVYGKEAVVETNVYLHYYSDAKSLVSLKNNTVTPTHYGEYTVEYKAYDEYGNTATYSYEFLCEEAEEFSLSLSEVDTNALVGYETEIATASYVNESGKVSGKITAALKDSNVFYDVTGQTSFTPMYAGEYTITYEYSDYNVTATKSYVLTVEKHDEPLFFGDVNMPEYFIVGQEYTLPKAQAYHFSTGKPVALTPAVEVIYGTKKPQVLTGEKFTAEEEGKLTFRYTISYNSASAQKTYTSRAVDVGYGEGKQFDIAKYFYAPDSTLTADTNQIVMTTETEGATATFINAVESNKIETQLTITKTGNYFDVLEIWLTDSVDPSVSVNCSFIKIDEKESFISVNGGRNYESSETFYSGKILVFEYSEKNMSVKLGATEIPVKTDAKGEAFSGFPSGKAYVSYKVTGVEGRVQLYLNTLKNQIFYEIDGDYTEPMVTFYTYAGGEHVVGDLITVERCWIDDVLDPNITVEYRIKAPSGNYAVDENGVLLNAENARHDTTYTFKAKEIGSYSVEIVAKDSAGNRAFYAYAIKVVDAEAPTVSLKDDMPTEVNVGTSITISDLSIFDNVSEEFEVYACVFTPRGKSEEVELGKAYKLSMTGKYRICYVVTDKAGNTTVLYHNITVK